MFMKNEYNYNNHKGFFNIYQGKSGGIYLQMANNITVFSLPQLKDLNIDLYSLRDFDIDDFNKYYQCK